MDREEQRGREVQPIWKEKLLMKSKQKDEKNAKTKERSKISLHTTNQKQRNKFEYDERQGKEQARYEGNRPKTLNG
jgi:hypothetical protein